MTAASDVEWKSVAEDDLRVGCIYRVAWDDCCVAGEFTSRLVEIEVERQPDGSDYPIAYRFENGVRLEVGSYGFEEQS